MNDFVRTGALLCYDVFPCDHDGDRSVGNDDVMSAETACQN